MSASRIRIWHLLPTLLGAAVCLSACTQTVPPQRVILDRQGEVRGLSRQSLTIEVEKDDVVQIVLDQDGLDLYLQLSLNGRDLGRYESMTGRYGEDRVQVQVPQGGELALTLGAARFPEVTGHYHLVARCGGTIDSADALYTQASRIDQPLASPERIRRFSEAAGKFAWQQRSREEGLAALGALKLLDQTESDSRSAIENGERAEAAFRKADAPLLLATALAMLASAHSEAGQNEAMASNYSEARRLYEDRGSKIGVAEVRMFEAVRNYAGQDSAALLATFREVARECHELHERVCEASALTDVAVMVRNSGKYQETLDNLYRALSLVDQTADSAPFAEISDNLAFSLRKAGDFDAAIFHHERALQAFATYGECSGVTRSLFGIGHSLMGIGDNAQALRYFKLALERSCRASDWSRTRAPDATALTPRGLCQQALNSLQLDTDDRSIAGWTTRDLGNFARGSSDPATALTCHEISTQLAGTSNERLATRLEQVRDLLELGRSADAQALYATLGPSLAQSNPLYRAQGTEVDARLLAARGETSAAIARYTEAAHAFRGIASYEGEFSALSRRVNLASSVKDRHAIDYFVDADAALEDVRLLSLDPSFSASLFSNGRGIYEQWIETQLSREIDPGSPQAALRSLAISERSRGRLLAQLAKASRIGREARAARLRSTASGTLNVLEAAEAGKMQTAGATQANDSALLNRSLGLQDTRFDATAFEASVARVDAWRKSLDDGSVAVEYLLGEQHSYAWVISKNAAHRVDIGKAAPIREAAAALRGLIDSPAATDARPILGRLHALLWQPVEPWVRGKRVSIVPDDVLYEVPFAALWDDARSEYLIEQVSLTYLPSIQFVASQGTRPAADVSKALLVGDPVYELEDARARCVPAAQMAPAATTQVSLRRIPGSFLEVEAIDAVFRAHARPADLLVGCEATRAHFVAEHPIDYQFIHFATHATADRVLPQRSAVYLSEWNATGQAVPATLTAGDLLEHPLRADLVVLSGCSTAGGREFSGEGSLGLSFSLISGGTRQVVSTQWPVADAASVAAMTGLYAGIIERNESATDALRAAQLEMLHGKRWNHFRNWAAYSLLGS